MAKRPTSRASDGEDTTPAVGDAPAPTDDAPPEAPDAPPAHVEAALAAEAAVAETSAPPLDPPPLEPEALETGAETEEPVAVGTAAPFGFAGDSGSATTTINSLALSTANNTDTLALGLAPAESFALLDATMAETLGMAMHNAVARQQSASVVSQALISAACARMVERAGQLVATAPPPPIPPLTPAPSTKPAAEKTS